MNHPKFKSVLSLIRGGAIAALVLFSLTPCIVKDTVLESFDLTHIRPINKTQVVLENTPCQDRPSEVQYHNYKEKQSQECDSPVTCPDIAESAFPIHHSASLGRPGSNAPSHYYPPKYILFKRLKIAIA